MMTRDEFEEQLHRFAREWHGDIWAAMPGSKADDLRSPAIRAALLAVYDAQAARITELEADRDHWRNLVDDLQNNGIYLDSIAFYEGRHAESTARIAELEAALFDLFSVARELDDEHADDGGGITDSWQSAEWKATLKRAKVVLSHKEA